MAKQASLFLPTGANNQSVTFVNADGTTAKTLVTAGSNDTDVKSIIVASNDSAAVNLQLFINRSAVAYLLGTVNIPITAGNTGAIASVDLLGSTLIPGLPLDSIGKPYIPMKTGDTLTVAPLAAVTTAKTCYISAFGQDY
jgi:hypothetical protein